MFHSPTVQLKWECKGLREQVLGSIWSHTKDSLCESMQPRIPEQVLVHGWEFAFKLHRPRGQMHRTWRSTEGTEMSCSDDTLLLDFTNKQQTIYNSKTNKSLFGFFPLVHLFLVFWSSSYDMKLNYYIESYLVSPWTNTGVAKCIIWQAWSNITGNMLHSTEGSLLDIHWPNRPITAPITYICTGWMNLEETKHLTLVSLALMFCHLGTETL